jgi:enoyl-CoA hydratase
MRTSPYFLYEKRVQIAIMTWNRPEAANCFTPEMIDAFYDAFDDFNKDDELRVAILAAKGDKAWCAGGDLDTMIPAVRSGEWKINEDPTKRVFHDIFKPIICAVNGFATVELIQGADLVVASENAKFALGEVRWGMIAAGGSHVRVPRYIPWMIAMELLLTGRPISARRAYEVGMVNRLVPTVAEVMPAAMKLAEQICENGPLAVRTAKEISVRCWNHEPAYVLENALFQRVRHSEDAEEGPRAYVEKRKPVYKGK